MVPELKITMLGARGVGKTSLLTAMYEQLDKTIGATGLQVVPNPETSARLQKQLGELKALLDDFEATGGLEGTEEPQYFYFDLRQPNRPPSLRLTFQDFPGGYLDKNPDFVEQAMTECVAVLIAIDTPALMEENGRWNDSFNKPNQICDFFKRTYQNLQGPKLVILVPIRCEKYVQNKEEAKILLRRVKESYADMLNFFSSQELLTKVACVVTPVQTVGTVHFSIIRETGGKPTFFFRKISHNASYQPHDSDQPLRYVLCFILKLAYQASSGGFFNFLWLLFRRNNFLIEAISQCALMRKNDNDSGFAILQGADKLKLSQ